MLHEKIKKNLWHGQDHQIALKSCKHKINTTKIVSQYIKLLSHTGTVKAGTILTFGYGPMNCIGKNFAMLELKTGTARFLQNFKMSMDDDGEFIERKQMLTVRLKPEIHIRFQNIKRWLLLCDFCSINSIHGVGYWFFSYSRKIDFNFYSVEIFVFNQSILITFVWWGKFYELTNFVITFKLFTSKTIISYLISNVKRTLYLYFFARIAIIN